MTPRVVVMAAFLVFFASFSPVGAYETQTVSNGGTISGTVQWHSGFSRTKIATNVDNDACREKIVLDNFVTGPNHALTNAVVYLSDILSGDAPSSAPLTLSHKDCLMTPRIQLAFPGTDLLLQNFDFVAHTFFASIEDRPLFKVALPLRGQQTHRTLSNPGLMKITCGPHRWETAWIFVSPHPYAAVTDAQGRFTFKNVPAGTYELKVWHEGWKLAGNRDYGRIEFEPLWQVMKVTVNPGATVQVVLSNLKPSAPSEVSGSGASH